ncbi:DUF6994 family protein [Staphylococcus simulans]|uniref:DUF6994 family protein n=1 Tax=Staphylococcus simulans TaxID=1286 RepID=UPI001F34E2F1|nr:hypothetical protein [Staphylococcus simulans]
MGHLTFPAQKNSINQIKGILLGDRIDYTLFDIKEFYNYKPELRLQKTYSQKTTRDWLKSFSSFNHFIDSMRLNYFVYSNTAVSSEYNVIDLSKPYKNTSDHCLEAIPKKVKFEENYVANIIQYIKNCGEDFSTNHSSLMYNYHS